MNYLKKFNETKDNFLELKYFCESNLAYLLDEGLQIRISYKHNYEICLSFYECTTSFIKKGSNLGCGVKWGDIRDEIIPFLSYLVTKYELVTNKGYNNYHKFIDYQIQFKMLSHSSSTKDWFDSTYDDIFTIDEIIDERVNKDISNTIMYIILEIRKPENLKFKGVNDPDYITPNFIDILR